MSRILLADDSPHAQRMGARILQEEGFEVTCVAEGESATERLAEIDPDLILADAFLPGKTGYDICSHVKSLPRHRHVRVLLLAGPLDSVDEEQIRQVHADGVLRKPFEASAILETVRPLIQAAVAERPKTPGASQPSEIDAERVRAAVVLALDAALPAMIDEITERVLVALKS